MERTVKFGGNAVPLLGKEIKVGVQAPEFAGVGVDLQPVKLSDYEGKIKVISIFPSIDTPVCSMQTSRFNQEAGNLGKDVVILSISCDLPFAQKRFCGAEGVENIVMISDHRNVEFGQKYGYLMDGLRLLARGVVILDTENKVRYVEYVPEVTNEPDYDKALSFVKSLL